MLDLLPGEAKPAFILFWGSGRWFTSAHDQTENFHYCGLVCGSMHSIQASIGLKCGFRTTSSHFHPIQGERFHQWGLQVCYGSSEASESVWIIPV